MVKSGLFVVKFLGSQKLYMNFQLHIGLPSLQFSSVQSFSHVQLFAIPCIATRQASLSITNSRSSLKLMSMESVMPSCHLIPFSSCLQSFPASGSFPMSQFFSSGGQSIGVSASASVLPMKLTFPLIDFFFLILFYF